MQQFGTFDDNGTTPGALRPVVFPSLMSMDVETGDHRLLRGEGASVRPLPLAIKAQFDTAPGHMGAAPVGVLQELTFENDGNVAGRGWLVNTEATQRLIPLLEAKALYRNSVDLADTTVELEWKSDDPKDPDFWNYTLNFTEWAIGATTFVDLPAFANAHGIIGEVTASYSSSPLEVRFADWTAVVSAEGGASPEITASIAGPTVDFDDFHIPESPERTPITIDAAGRVFGHLAEWGTCHEGIEGRCVIAPRPADYADFHGPSVMTTRGLVQTGPIFFLGGHPAKPLGDGDRWAAYGGIENAWADVRVANGRIGPWVSGRVRPGVGPNALYAARASRISGHWRTNGTLAAIVSCNVAGYNIPGSKLLADRDGAVFGTQGELLELTASLHTVGSPLNERLNAETRILATVNRANLTYSPPMVTPIVQMTPDTTNSAIIATQTFLPFTRTNGDEIDDECAAIGSHKTATASGSWDGPANEARLPSPMPKATARKAYAWMDSAAGSEVTKSQCKFIHHNVDSGGSPGAANLTACSAGIAVLNGGRGGANIPSGDRSGVYNHLAGHLRDGGKEPPKLMSDEEVEAAAVQIEMLLLESDAS